MVPSIDLDNTITYGYLGNGYQWQLAIGIEWAPFVDEARGDAPDDLLVLEFRALRTTRD